MFVSYFSMMAPWINCVSVNLELNKLFCHFLFHNIFSHGYKLILINVSNRFEWIWVNSTRSIVFRLSKMCGHTIWKKHIQLTIVYRNSNSNFKLLVVIELYLNMHVFIVNSRFFMGKSEFRTLTAGPVWYGTYAVVRIFRDKIRPFLIIDKSISQLNTGNVQNKLKNTVLFMMNFSTRDSRVSACANVGWRIVLLFHRLKRMRDKTASNHEKKKTKLWTFVNFVINSFSIDSLKFISSN